MVSFALMISEVHLHHNRKGGLQISSLFCKVAVSEYIKKKLEPVSVFTYTQSSCFSF